VFRFQGLIEFSRLSRGLEQPLAVVQDDAFDHIELPGLTLRWNRAFVAVALDDGVLAVAAGRARDPGGAAAPAGHGEAMRWIQRYRRLGERAATGVGGGFAVTIIDTREQRAVLLVDRFSIETMCYCARGDNLGFSDSARNVPGADGEIDPQSIYDYLYLHVIPAPQTVFRDVRRVENANCVVADAKDVRSQVYWEPVFEEHDDRDLAGRMRQFVDAVQRSVAEEADEAGTACFLSGGTDSSTIAGMLTRVRGEPVHGYSIGFESAGYDEMEYARVAARHFGVVHHEYYVTPDDLVSAIPRVAASFDQPFGNSSVLPAYYCALRAREDGHTRMLAGDGGDELYGGNSRYALQKVFELYHMLPEGLRRSVLEPPATRWSAFRKVPGLRQAGGYVRHSRLPMPDRMAAFNLLHRIGETALLEPAFLERVDAARIREQQRATWQAARADSMLNRMLAYDWKYTLADSDLPKVRGATRLAGVSVGYPFLSRELTDLSLGIPPQWKVKGLKLRWFFKEALHDFLPAAILRKKKHGFGLPFGPWCLRHAPLRRLAEESLEGVAARGIVRSGYARELLAKRLPEAPGFYGEMVWILMMLEQWLRRIRRKQSLPRQ
jgi:asparagine synthase (glutamine-hydrolysing)